MMVLFNKLKVLLPIYLQLIIYSEAFSISNELRKISPIQNSNHNWLGISAIKSKERDDDDILDNSKVTKNEEPLSAMFNRAVVYQRSGNHKEALRIYQMFLQAVKQIDSDIDPKMYSEVYVNLGSIYFASKERNLEKSRYYFEKAVEARPDLGTAHVNLALLELQEASQIVSDPKEGINKLLKAKSHCQEAIKWHDDKQSFEAAMRLLGQIDGMLGKMETNN